MKVSILMTSYNTEKFIKEAIESVMSQTFTNWELLLADDCSSDNTRQVIETFNDSRIRVFHNEQRLHYLRTRNRLIKFADGDFICLLDSDDRYDPVKLEKQLLAFESNSSLHLVGTHVYYTDVHGKTLNYRDSKPLSYEEITSQISLKNAFTGSTIMVRTSTMKELGGYRDFFNSLGYEDYDLTSRLVERHRAINLPDPLYYYRQYPESTSRYNMLYNPFKLNGHLLVQHFINERKEYGIDSLDRNDIPGIINFIVDKHKPYIDDPSLVHREVMWSFASRKMFKSALIHISIAIKVRPFNWKNLRALGIMLLLFAGIIKE